MQQTLTELAAELEAGNVSSREIVGSVLTAIETRDAAIGAYVAVDAEQALLEADASDARRAQGDTASLLGLPVAVKDLFHVRGQSCACASDILRGYRAPYDATAVARLKSAGAIVLGRLNMDEFAMGSSTENSAHGVTRNPWNTGCVPGGSSGGSAACVAAGTALAALGSDTGGSVRQPAAFCGCVGLKPTYGRISRFGLTAFASSLDQVGPLTRSVADAALLLQVLAGYDSLDSTSLHAPVPDYRAALQEDLRGVRLGVPREYFVEGLDSEVRARVEQAIEQCRSLGAELREVSLPHTEHAIATYYVVATAEASANLARFDGVRYGLREEGKDPIDTYRKSREAGFGTEVKRRIVLGTYVLSSGYHDAFYTKAQQVRTLIRRDFEQVFSEVDALLAPVTPTAAFRIGEQVDDPLKMYLNDVCTVPVNLAGVCGLSVPCGFTAANLPVGLQVIGPALGEEIILRVGHAYQQATDWPTLASVGQE